MSLEMIIKTYIYIYSFSNTIIGKIEDQTLDLIKIKDCMSITIKLKLTLGKKNIKTNT